MIFVLIYIIIGLVFTAIVDYVNTKEQNACLSLVQLAMSVLAWPVLFIFGIYESFIKERKQ